MFPEYTVQKGDTLSKIADSFYGDISFYKQLAEFNNIEDPDVIEIGQILMIPAGFYKVEEAIRENGISVHKTKLHSSNETEALEGLMIFCPIYVGTGREAFMYIPPSDAQEFINQLDSLDMDRKDFSKASKKAREIKDPKERTKALDDVEKRFKDKYVKSLKPGDAKPDFQELIILNKWKPKKLKETYRYIKSSDINDKKWVAETPQKLEQKMREEAQEKMDSKNKLSDYVTAKVKANLWKLKDPPEGQIFPEWKFASSKDAWKDNNYIAASYDVAFLRYAANAEVGAEFDLREGVVQVNACGSASFALAEGKADIELNLPDKNGFDLFSAIKEIISDKFFKKNRTCIIKVVIKGEVYGFVGAQAAISIPKIELNLKGEDASIERYRAGASEKQKVTADLSVSAFAGASGTISATIEGAWKNVYEKNAWGTIAKEGGALSGRAGIGGEAGIKFEFKNGKVLFSARAQLVVGIGGKAELLYELDFKEGFQLMAHFLESVAYHDAIEITSDCFKAFYKFHLYVFTQSTNMLSNLGKGIINTVTDWWDEDSIADKKATLIELDEIKLRQAPPESLGRLIQLIMKNHDRDDYMRILSILEQSKIDLKDGQENHELRWIIRFITKKETQVVKASKELYLKEGVKKLRDFFNDINGYARSEHVKQLEIILKDVK